MWVLEAIGRWFKGALHDGWLWVASLTHQEWFLLLGITAAAGFLCMKGMGSRKEF